MKFFRSIRTKLTLWHTVWLAAILLAFGTTAYFYTRSVLSENLDLSLRNEVKWVNEFIEPKAKKVRLKRSAVQELQQLKKKAAEEEQLEEKEQAENGIKNRPPRHIIGDKTVPTQVERPQRAFHVGQKRPKITTLGRLYRLR